MSAAARRTATVTYFWHVDGLPLIEQKRHGRRVRIDPREVRIIANKGRDGGNLTVYIEGQTVRMNGTPGQQRRLIAYSDQLDRFFPGELMRELPAEYQGFLAAARRAEQAR